MFLCAGTCIKYTNTHMHTTTCTHINIYLTNMHVHVCTNTMHVYVQPQILELASMHTRNMHSHAFTHTYIHTWIITYSHMCKYTQNMYIHTCTPPSIRRPVSLSLAAAYGPGPWDSPWGHSPTLSKLLQPPCFCAHHGLGQP